MPDHTWSNLRSDALRAVALSGVEPHMAGEVNGVWGGEEEEGFHICIPEPKPKKEQELIEKLKEMKEFYQQQSVRYTKVNQGFISLLIGLPQIRMTIVKREK